MQRTARLPSVSPRPGKNCRAPGVASAHAPRGKRGRHNAKENGAPLLTPTRHAWMLALLVLLWSLPLAHQDKARAAAASLPAAKAGSRFQDHPSARGPDQWAAGKD